MPRTLVRSCMLAALLASVVTMLACFPSLDPGGSGGAGGTTAGLCPAPIPRTTFTCSPTVTGNACQVDADCAATIGAVMGGHCVSTADGMQCTYDVCLTDDDCGAAPAVCLCQGQWRAWAGATPGNGCGVGNCRSDADCAGTTCSPSSAPQGSFYGWIGYFRHTPQDQCRCDADCGTDSYGTNGYCAYDPEVAKWACSYGTIAG